MAITRKKFSKGIRIKKNTDAMTLEGEITVDSVDNKLKTRLDSADRSVVTEDQTQTVTNKTIDADNNTISNLETDNLKAGVLVTDVSTATSDTEIPSALAVKTALEGQNEASEITYSNTTSGLTATDVQAAVDEVEGRLDTAETGISDHLADAVDAHDASAISNVPSGNLAATDVQGALNELQSDIDTRATSTDLSNHITDTVDAHEATAIGYTPNGTQTISAGSIEVQAAVGELDDESDDVRALTGTTKNDRNLGVLSGSTYPDNATIKAVLQAAESAHETHEAATTGVHGITGNFVGTTDTQDLSNKTFTDAITLEELASTPTNPAAGDKKFYAKNDGKVYTLDSAGNEVEVGSGAGGTGINYLVGDDSNAETSPGNWAEYDDGAVAIPVDGTGGTPTVISINNSTSNVLRGTKSFRITKLAADGQGEGVAVPFTIDAADQAKKLTISFDYDTINNNYVDADMKIFVYDVTNASIIRVNGEDLQAGSGTHYAQFQTAPDSTSYRLIIHQATASLLGVTISFDNVSVGPTNLAYGTVVTDWEDLSGVTSTNFTTSSVTAKYRRVGDSANIQIQAISSSVASGILEINIPSTLPIDESKMADGTGFIGTVNFTDLSTNTMYAGRAYQSGTNSQTLRFYGPNTSAWSVGTPVAMASGDQLDISIEVPIQGWSSNARMSEDLGGRDVVLNVSHTAATAITSTPTKLSFNTVDEDTVSGYSSGTYTVQETGYYDISGQVGLASASWTSGALSGRLYIDGSPDKYLFSDGAFSSSAVTAAVIRNGKLTAIKLNKGQTVELYVSQNQTASINTQASSDLNYFQIALRPDSQTMLETETVAAEYTINSAKSQTASKATLAYDVIIKDTHNAYNTSTGVYTIPASGFYSVRASIASTVGAWANLDFLEVSLRVDSAVDTMSDQFHRVTSTSSTSYQVALSDIIYFDKGQTLEVQTRNSQSRDLSGTGKYTRFAIARIK